jgi:hypothetical protein
MLRTKQLVRKLHPMKQTLFILLILLSCTKEKEPEPKCWECVDQYNTSLPPINTVTYCDPIEAAKQNGRRWFDGKWHLITCKLK